MQRKEGYFRRLFLLLVIIFNFAGCGSNSSDTQGLSSLPTNESKVTITQGVWGNVWFWEGNFMPTITAAESTSGKITPVIREIFVHRVTTKSEISPYSSGVFYTFIPSDLVAKTSSDQTGFYQVALSPGTYSVFVKEGSVFYSSRFDSQERVNSVEVLPGTSTKLQLDVIFQAAF